MSASVQSEITGNDVVTNAAFLLQTTDSTNLITMYPKEQMAKLSGPAITEAVLKKWAKDGYRARANTLINSKNIMGLLFLSQKGQLRVLYLPQVVTSEDGTTCTCAVVTQKSMGPQGTVWGSKPVYVTREKLAPFFPPATITAGIDLFVGKVAASMPVPSNVENITVGDLNNRDVEATPTSIHDEWGANWAYHMSEYDSGLVDVLLKEETLRQYLPATLLQEWADPTNTIYNRHDGESEDIDVAEDKIVHICKQRRGRE